LSLRLLVDEDTQDARLVSVLRQEAHDVLTVNEAGLPGQADSVVLAHAFQERRIVLTMNCRDFLELHEAAVAHAGIIGIYKDRDPRKNMTFAAMSTALANLIDSGWEFSGQFVVLNAWNY